MTSFTLHDQLLIILVFVLMAQSRSAPVNDITKRFIDIKKMNQRKLENNMYCVAQSLHDAGEDLCNKYYN